MGGLFRNKTLLTLIILIAIGMTIGAAHNRQLSKGGHFALQDTVRSVLAPVDVVSHTVFSVGNVTLRVFRPRSAILRENARLRREVRRLTRENARLHEVAAEEVRLRTALNLAKSWTLDMIPAEVISRNESSWFDTATINRGRQAGVVKGSAVINYSGILVGQVVDANPFTAQIVALTDSNSSVGATIQRSRSSGVLQGQGSDYLVLAYLPKDADVKAKDLVVSSGMGHVVPKGLLIGRVVRVVRNSIAGTTSALVRPSTGFDSVEQVFAIKPGQNQGS
ncbi:MAG: rod shape-determining protein MreC [Armatimonadota bacterium]|nr:rod shape-determining protein MreC [bacterium]